MVDPSYHRSQPAVVTEKMRRQIAAAVAEIDLAQIAVARHFTPAERAEQAFALIALAQQVATYRLRVRDPDLSEVEALRIVRGIGIVEYERQKHHKQDV